MLPLCKIQESLAESGHAQCPREWLFEGMQDDCGPYLQECGSVPRLPAPSTCNGPVLQGELS